MEAPLLWAAAHPGGSAAASVSFVGFGQVMQSLLDPRSEFMGNASGVNVLLVRPKDIPVSREFSRALQIYDGNPCARALCCVIICPQLEERPDGWDLELARCSKVMCAELAPPLWTFRQVDFELTAEEAGAVPYSEWLYRGIGVIALRMASYATRRPFKALCVDCDNTL